MLFARHPPQRPDSGRGKGGLERERERETESEGERERENGRGIERHRAPPRNHIRDSAHPE